MLYAMRNVVSEVENFNEIMKNKYLNKFRLLIAVDKSVGSNSAAD